MDLAWPARRDLAKHRPAVKFSVTSERTLFAGFGLASLVAAAYHAAVLAGQLPNLGGSSLRHACFVALGLVGLGGFRRRPTWFAYGFVALTLQQLVAHGTRAWSWWSANGSIDWLSLPVLVLMPIASAMLLCEVLQRGRACT